MSELRPSASVVTARVMALAAGFLLWLSVAGTSALAAGATPALASSLASPSHGRAIEESTGTASLARERLGTASIKRTPPARVDPDPSPSPSLAKTEQAWAASPRPRLRPSQEPWSPTVAGKPPYCALAPPLALA